MSQPREPSSHFGQRVDVSRRGATYAGEYFCAFEIFQSTACLTGLDRRNPNRNVVQNLDENTPQAHHQRWPQLFVARDPEETFDSFDLLLNQNTFDIRTRFLCFYICKHFLIGELHAL